MSITQLAAQVANTCRWFVDKRKTISIPQSPSEAELCGLADHLSSPHFEIGVIGLQGHGKSALVNAILGEAVVYSGPEIAQNRVIRIEYGKPLVRLIKDGVTLHECPISKLGDIGRRGGIKVEQGVQILATTTSEFLLDGVCIADTPGGDAGIDGEADDAQVRSYLSNASVVLVATHSTKPGLAKIFQLINDAGRNVSDLVVALTASDLLDEDDLEEAVQATERQMRIHFGRDVPVCPVSAQEAMRAGDADLDAVHGIDSLRQQLRQLALRTQVGMVSRAFSTIESVGCEWRHSCLVDIQGGAAEISRLEACYKSEMDASKAESVRLQGVLAGIATTHDDALNDIASPLWWDLHSVNDRVDEYIRMKDIVSINAKLSDFTSTLLDQFAKSATQQIMCVLEDYNAALERQLASVGIKMILDTTADLSTVSTTIRLPPQPVGPLAWMDDPDDSKRRARASYGAKNQLAAECGKAAIEITNKVKEHILNLEAQCKLCIHAALTLIEERVSYALCDLQIEEAKQRDRQNEQKKLIRLLSEADEQLEPMRAIAFILKELGLTRCAAVVGAAWDSSSADFGGFENLILCLRQVASKYPEADDDISSFFAHIQAGLFYLEFQQLDEVLRQAELARDLSDCVPTEQRTLPTKLASIVIRRQSGIDASLDYLQANCSDEELVAERIVASLFTGRMYTLRSILGGAKQSELDGRVRLMASYVLGAKNNASAYLTTADGIAILAECHRKLDVEVNTEPFCDAIKSDKSLERHVVAKMRQWAKMDIEEQDIVTKAYGQIQPREELLPISALNELDLILGISKSM